MLKKILGLLLVVVFSLSSCSHDEGYGGSATIKGKVYGLDFNSSGTLVGQGYIGGFKVYISKHGNTNYFDRVDTAYDGSFTFKYLYKGTYDVWVFGDCDSCQWDQIYVLKTITVGSKNAVVETEDFIVSF